MKLLVDLLKLRFLTALSLKSCLNFVLIRKLKISILLQMKIVKHVFISHVYLLI